MIRLKHTDDQIYEYACHEGNHSMIGILAGARADEKARERQAAAKRVGDAESRAQAVRRRSGIDGIRDQRPQREAPGSETRAPSRRERFDRHRRASTGHEATRLRALCRLASLSPPACPRLPYLPDPPAVFPAACAMLNDHDSAIGGDRAAAQQPRAGALRQLDRHDDRVLRLLHLRHRGRARLPEAVLPVHRPGVSHARLARHLRRGVLRPANRLGVLRSLRRSHRAQDHPRRRPADDGRVDGGDRAAADVRVDRDRRAAAARAVPLRTGARARWRVGRSGAARHRECAARQARLVRHVPAAWRARSASSSPAASFCCCRRCSPTSSSSPSAGGCRSWQAPSW